MGISDELNVKEFHLESQVLVRNNDLIEERPIDCGIFFGYGMFSIQTILSLQNCCTVMQWCWHTFCYNVYGILATRSLLKVNHEALTQTPFWAQSTHHCLHLLHISPFPDTFHPMWSPLICTTSEHFMAVLWQSVQAQHAFCQHSISQDWAESILLTIYLFIIKNFPEKIIIIPRSQDQKLKPNHFMYFFEVLYPAFPVISCLKKNC